MNKGNICSGLDNLNSAWHLFLNKVCLNGVSSSLSIEICLVFFFGYFVRKTLMARLSKCLNLTEKVLEALWATLRCMLKGMGHHARR